MVSTKFATLITAFGIVAVCSKSSEGAINNRNLRSQDSTERKLES